MHTTGRHDATAGTYITCGVVLVLAILLVVWAIRGGPFNPPVPATDPTPIPVVIVTPDTQPPSAVPTVPAAVPTGVPTAQPTVLEPEKRKTRTPLPAATVPQAPPPVPTALATTQLPAPPPTSQVRAVLAEPPCWSNARRPHPSCTPTPFPPSPSETAVPTHTNTPTHTASATPTGTAVPSGTPTPSCTEPDPVWCGATQEAFEQEVARLINLHRTGPPHEPWWESGIALQWRADLSAAQRPWAEQMVANNECYHGDFGGRAAAQGYTGWAWAEIGSCGYPSPAAAVQGWVDSAGHHWAMDEAEAMTEFGVGSARYENGYWSTWVIIGCGGGIPCMAGRP